MGPAMRSRGDPLSSDAASPSDDARDLLPVRMLNEFAYCPRLFHLMHVEGQWADNVYTVEGKYVHRRVDKLDQVLPDPQHDGSDEPENDEKPRERKRHRDDGDELPEISRSVPLASDALGLTAKLDLVVTAPGDDGDQEAVPVETKRGRVPDNEQRSYEPERVQLMAQGLLLREHGYRTDHGVLYFAGSRTRVDVPLTHELEARTLSLIEQARHATRGRDLPPPLEDSPKCYGCSLSGICLPDETLALREVPVDPPDVTTDHAVRRLYPAREDALPLYVQEQGARVGKSGKSLVVRQGKDELARVGIKDVSQLVLCGGVSVSAQTIHLLCNAGIPVVHLSMGHWFYGVTQGVTLRNAYDRAAQYAAVAQPHRCLEFARSLVAAKGANQRTLLRRNAPPADRSLNDIAELLNGVDSARDLPALLGFEGAIAAHYFRRFSGMLHPRDFDAEWDFRTRNRRPPRDPVNAMLSFGYALLAKECTTALLAAGLDPWWGLYHQPRHGRPSLALDLMEPLRPVIVDSAVVTAINTGMVRARDFVHAKSGCVMKDRARKALIRAYESRLDQLISHPVFDYRCSWRAVIAVQARLLARWLRGDIPTFTNVVTR